MPYIATHRTANDSLPHPRRPPRGHRSLRTRRQSVTAPVYCWPHPDHLHLGHPVAFAGGPCSLPGPSQPTPNRNAVLLLLLGPSLPSLSSLLSPSLPPSKNLVQTALWVLPQTNELLDDSFYAVAPVVDLPRWINTNAILRCHMRLFAYRAASSHISAHAQTQGLQLCFSFEHLSITVDLFACHSFLYPASASRLFSLVDICSSLGTLTARQ
ncbi:hypothetical protein F5883DRAFT_7022 [Diaporthe sp. PMI_573]|nr:hypothetical protein F5883DRAFT_7022 [Diaporthaceae sp. PMI_573]